MDTEGTHAKIAFSNSLSFFLSFSPLTCLTINSLANMAAKQQQQQNKTKKPTNQQNKTTNNKQQNKNNNRNNNKKVRFSFSLSSVLPYVILLFFYSLPTLPLLFSLSSLSLLFSTSALLFLVHTSMTNFSNLSKKQSKHK
jgi:hypothetical protein